MKPTAPRRSSEESETYHRALLREQARSGQTVRDFAAARGLSAATLYAWRRRIGVTRPSGGRGRLVEVAVVSGPQDAARNGLVLHLFGRHRLELPRDLSADEWQRLLAVLSSC